MALTMVLRHHITAISVVVWSIGSTKPEDRWRCIAAIPNGTQKCKRVCSSLSNSDAVRRVTRIKSNSISLAICPSCLCEIVYVSRTRGDEHGITRSDIGNGPHCDIHGSHRNPVDPVSGQHVGHLDHQCIDHLFLSAGHDHIALLLQTRYNLSVAVITTKERMKRKHEIQDSSIPTLRNTCD